MLRPPKRSIAAFSSHLLEDRLSFMPSFFIHAYMLIFLVLDSGNGFG